MQKTFTYLHKYSAVENKAPLSGDIQTAEIAVNGFPGKEKLFIKNANNEVVAFERGGGSFDLPIYSGTGADAIVIGNSGNTAGGRCSIAAGRRTEASGTESFAIGQDTKARGALSFVMGDNSVANGFASAALGKNISARNNFEVGLGNENLSSSATTVFGNSGNTLFSVGNGDAGTSTRRHNALEIRQNGDIYIADINAEGEYYEKPMILLQDALGSFDLPIYSGTGDNAIVISDSGNTASGSHSVAEGKGTTASGYFSHSEGQATTASGTHSHSEGYGTTASGNKSHSEGEVSQAKGTSSHAEGYGSVASGTSSHAEGQQTTAKANYSHSEGYITEANGEASHSSGVSTKTNNKGELASGIYNVSTKNDDFFGDSGNTLFSLGNGGNNSARHNAFEVKEDGSVYYADLSGGTNYYDRPMLKLQDEFEKKMDKESIVICTQQEYDDMGTHNPTTLYIIND